MYVIYTLMVIRTYIHYIYYAEYNIYTIMVIIHIYIYIYIYTLYILSCLRGSGRPKGSMAAHCRSQADKIIEDLDIVKDQFKLVQSDAEDVVSEDSDDAGTRSFLRFVEQHDKQIRKSALQSRAGPDASDADDGSSSQADKDPAARPSGAASSGGLAGPIPHVPALDAQSLPSIQIGSLGWVKIDLRNRQFNAHCNCLDVDGPNRRDHRTPTMPECRKNRKMKKAPLGFLIQWLRMGSFFEDRKDHKDSDMIITYQDRCECREWLKAQPDLQHLLQLEADALGVPMLDVVEPMTV
jgi:hypothetical protein